MESMAGDIQDIKAILETKNMEIELINEEIKGDEAITDVLQRRVSR